MIPALKAVSLWQPWATLIALGFKRFETRSWQTSHHGPLAIHATKGIPEAAKPDVRRFLRKRACVDLLEPLGLHELEDFPMGKILCISELERCFRSTTLMRSMVAGHGEARGVDECAFGDYSDGMYAWALGEPLKLEKPIDCKGAQQLWPVPPDVGAAIAEQFRSRAATLPFTVYEALGFDPAIFGTNIPVRAALGAGSEQL